MLTTSIEAVTQKDNPITQCGGYLDGPAGHIQTPDFPKPFPLPLSCKWILYTPPGYKAVVYFTQFYVRHGFTMAEYELYEDEDFYIGKTDLGTVNFEEEMESVQPYKPYLVLRFNVGPTMGNMHLRVEHFLLDVYGFNITYEIIPKVEPQTPACSVHNCSFLGNCLASRDYRQYTCQCFDGFYGEHCQFGPYCDPAIGMNMCRNGGTCRSVLH
ncbi:hypothetical protein CAPTEDRAFT_140026 [Capitella teleta]|uniref:CUB domain-containing protein n=1 Tax=Capitella teleta TaxID=283909 RepID=R7VIL3_CAPTE|nr:hypothetical protein CAPTEDRAFT_140026 [Capitella teleta]|eukprot:ELU16131.1 hypothetical protein CAPTEDRAFT_140026 [Capitella teleta]